MVRTIGPQSPVLVTATTGECLTTAEAKEHLRITATSTSDDADIARLILVASRNVERLASVQLMPATYRIKLDAFPCWELKLPLPPLRAVSSIGYVDTNGSTQTLSSTAYQVDIDSMPGRLMPGWGNTWPATRDIYNAVTITYTNGFADSTSIPPEARHAVRMMCSQLYEMREPSASQNIQEIPLGMKHLINSFAVPRYA